MDQALALEHPLRFSGRLRKAVGAPWQVMSGLGLEPLRLAEPLRSISIKAAMPARHKKERDPLRDGWANLGMQRLQILARQRAQEQG